jgi:hypothetical protein
MKPKQSNKNGEEEEPFIEQRFYPRASARVRVFGMAEPWVVVWILESGVNEKVRRARIPGVTASRVCVYAKAGSVGGARRLKIGEEKRWIRFNGANPIPALSSGG